MAQSLSNVLIHFVFSTKERRPFIHNDVESRLYKYITGICKNCESPLHQIGGMNDHIHILLSLSRKISLSDLVGEIKANSSRWIKKESEHCKDFSWQAGYGAFSIGKSGFEEAVKYIENQKEHHKVRNFQDEFRILLRKYEIEFDERYVWD